MEQAVRDLVVTPFGEIVAKAKVAAGNVAEAGDDAPPQMGKAAQSLQREGERALKKIEPLCVKHLAEYGASFLDELRANGEIAHFRNELNDLLWEFDDYIETDDFDADKFAELQALSRKAAPKIVDILMCMKLQPAPKPEPQQPQQQAPVIVAAPSSLPQKEDEGVALAPVISTEDESDAKKPAGKSDPRREIKLVMGARSGPDLGLNGDANEAQNMAVTPRTPHAEAAPGAEVAVVEAIETAAPREGLPEAPDVDPWSIGPAPAVGSPDSDDGDMTRREAVTSRPDSPTIPYAVAVSPTANDFKKRFEPNAPLPALPAPSNRTVREGAATNGRPPTSSKTNGINSTYVVSPLLRAKDARSPTSPSGYPAPPSYNDLVHQSSWPLNGGHGQHQHPAHQHQQQQQQHYNNGAAVVSMLPNGKQHQHQRRSAEHVLPSDSSSRYSQASSSAAESRGSSVFDHQEQRHAMSSATASPVMPAARASSLPGYAGGGANGGGNGGGQAAGSPRLRMSASFGRFPEYSMPSPALRPHYEEEGEGEGDRDGVEVVTLSPLRNGADLEPVPTNGIEVDSGLIPVPPPAGGESSGGAEGGDAPPSDVPIREADTNITLESSFFLMRGFCVGARECQRGGMGVKQTRKLGFGGGSAVAAKCKHCSYELEWKQVEADKLGYETANYVSQDIGFRLRILSKCHLRSKNMEDQNYGCPFCLQQGRTNEESDPTVFFSQKDLFAHFARHPRPLPAVPYLTVIEEAEIPEQYRNDYDLHFTKRQPVRSVMEGLGRELSMLPTATAVETVRRSTTGGGGSSSSSKIPPDRHTPLQFAVGARIVGVEFPAKYHGEWAVGWADNVRAPFPADAVKLDEPPALRAAAGDSNAAAPAAGSIKALQGASSLSAVVRWKFAHKDRTADWLKLEKGDVITNIQWAYPGHWCWAGTNSKGRWGIFPQSHIEPNSLMDGDRGKKGGRAGAGSAAGVDHRDDDVRSVSSSERKGSGAGGKLLSRMSVRRTATSSSQETAHPPAPSSRPTFS